MTATQKMVDIYLTMGIFRTLVGVYDHKEQQVHLLDKLTCSEKNMVTIACLCQSALQREQTEITIDSRFLQEKGLFR